MHSKVAHLLRYTGTNVISTIVDYTILLTLTHIFGMPVLQSAFAYSAAVVVNYGLMKKFVFNRRHVAQERASSVHGIRRHRFIGLVLTASSSG